jgi:hypothetical protein
MVAHKHTYKFCIEVFFHALQITNITAVWNFKIYLEKFTTESVFVEVMHSTVALNSMY